jgi:hypothetical protein
MLPGLDKQPLAAVGVTKTWEDNEDRQKRSAIPSTGYGTILYLMLGAGERHAPRLDGHVLAIERVPLNLRGDASEKNKRSTALLKETEIGSGLTTLPASETGDTRSVLNSGFFRS